MCVIYCMRNKSDIVKTAKTVKEARDIQKHIEALDLDYYIEVFGSFTEKEPKEGAPWDIGSKGINVEKLGYSYVYVEYEGNTHKIEPAKSKYSPGKIQFNING